MMPKISAGKLEKGKIIQREIVCRVRISRNTAQKTFDTNTNVLMAK